MVSDSFDAFSGNHEKKIYKTQMNLIKNMQKVKQSIILPFIAPEDMVFEKHDTQIQSALDFPYCVSEICVFFFRSCNSS